MTKKSLKLLLTIQAKSACWFIGIFSLTLAIILILLSFGVNNDASWIPASIIFAPKIYLLVMGIIDPLVNTKLYVSQGLTRKQFFWASTGAISIISLFLLIPVLASVAYYDSISLPSAVTHYLQMLLFYLIGQTSVLGFQMKNRYKAILGVLVAVVIFHAINTVPGIIALSEMTVFASLLLLLIAALLILPRFISKIPLKG